MGGGNWSICTGSEIGVSDTFYVCIFLFKLQNCIHLHRDTKLLIGVLCWGEKMPSRRLLLGHFGPSNSELKPSELLQRAVRQ